MDDGYREQVSLYARLDELEGELNRLRAGLKVIRSRTRPSTWLYHRIQELLEP